ncbi:Rho GTPase-activating protein 29-like [Oopsacas minuta]|uniref:Rho GTPase-activating protein 29-like n=1 Tax=Oopsacas minuta TaxID=111878 RepID=A0AAV7JJ89_9METZ|nr:Rho GTPase-activating protein 29-like [Oopsacas minuta]
MLDDIIIPIITLFYQVAILMNPNPPLHNIHPSPTRRFSQPLSLVPINTFPALSTSTLHSSRYNITDGAPGGPTKKLTAGSFLNLKSPHYDLRYEAQQCLDVIHKLEDSLKAAERNNYEINETQDGRPSVGERMDEVNIAITSTLDLLQLSDTSDISDLLSKLNDKIFPSPTNYRDKPDFSSFHYLIVKLISALCQCVEESDADYVEDFMSVDNFIGCSGKDTDIVDYKQKNLERDQKNEELERKMANMDEGVEFCLGYLKTLVKYFKELRTYAQNRSKEELNNFRRMQTMDQHHLSNLENLNKRVHVYFGTVSSQPIITHELERINERHAEQAIKNYVHQVNQKVLTPLNEHLKSTLENQYNNFKSSWVVEKKKVQDAENAMNRAKERYFQAGGSYDFTMHRSEKKDDFKRKKELEEARARLDECERAYSVSIVNANTCRKQHELFKGSIYCASRILATDSDMKLAQCLELFYRCQLEYCQPLPDYLSSVVERVKRVEPGTVFSTVVRSAHTSHKKNFDIKFEKYSSSFSVDPSTGKLMSEVGPDGEEYKRRTLAPSQSSPQAVMNSKPEHHQRAAALKAQQTHDLSRLMVPTRCRVCDHLTLLTGVSCSKCDVAVHTKCLPFLIVICGQTEVNKSQPLARCTTFGVSLEDQLKANNHKIPPILSRCIREIEDRGLDLQGIYRIAGVKNKVENLCASFETGDYKDINLSEEPPHLIASCLKLYFRQLPEPLFTFRLYDEFIPFSRKWDEMLRNPDLDAADEEKERLLIELRKLVQKLPRPNYIIGRRLLRHLRVIHMNASVNCMNSHNLGIVFGPTLFRPVELGISALAEISLRTKLVEIMIDNPSTFEIDCEMEDERGDNSEDPLEESKSDSETFSPVALNPRRVKLSLDDDVVRQPISNIKRNRSIKDITRMTNHITQFRETSPFSIRKKFRKPHQHQLEKHGIKSPTLSPICSGDTRVPSYSPNSRIRRKSNRSIDSLSQISVDSIESPSRERGTGFGDGWEFKKDSSNLTQDVVSAVFQLNLDDYLKHTSNNTLIHDGMSPKDDRSTLSRLRKSEAITASSPNILDAASQERTHEKMARSYSSVEEPEIGSSCRYETRRHPGTIPIPGGSRSSHDDLDTRSDITPINRSSSRESSSLDSATDDNSDPDSDHEDRLFLINIKSEYDHILSLPDQPTVSRPDSLHPNTELNQCKEEISLLRSQLDILITDCDKSDDERCSSSSSDTSSHYHTLEEHPSGEDNSPQALAKTKSYFSPSKEYMAVQPTANTATT